MIKTNKKNALVIIFIIGIMMTIFMPNKAYAVTEGDNFLNNISTGANSWKTMAENKASSFGLSTEDTLKPILAIAQFLYFIGGVVVLGGTIWLAVKYSMANPAEKAQTKERLIRWIVVCIVIMGSYALWRLLVLAFGS